MGGGLLLLEKKAPNSAKKMREGFWKL